VWKPRGHREATHVHPVAQRLRVLHGRLAVRMGRRTVVLTPARPSLLVRAGCSHETRALAGTWLLVERRRPR
jgi:hypothetical protein